MCVSDEEGAMKPGYQYTPSQRQRSEGVLHGPKRPIGLPGITLVWNHGELAAVEVGVYATPSSPFSVGRAGSWAGAQPRCETVMTPDDWHVEVAKHVHEASL